MKRKSDAITMAQVLLYAPGHDRAVELGWLSRVGDNLRLSFSEEYISDRQRPTLSQLYRGRDEGETTAILTAINDERLVRIGKLPAYFSNLLPEGVNRERLAQQRGCDEDDELELLAAAGHDLSGAVEVVPADNVPQGVLELHATKDRRPLEANAVAAPVDEGFSVDGFQTKFSMVHDGRRYVVRRGTAAGDYIAKLPSIRYRDIVRNEGVCYRLARAAGVVTADAVVRPIEELGVPKAVTDEFDGFLLVPRFDRFKRADGTTGRVHFEELTQALGIDSRHKYRKLQDAMRALLVILRSSETVNQAEFDEFFRRWTVNALMGNTDAHSKNWGFVYPDGVNARLAPAYDLVCVAAYFDPDNPLALAQNREMDKALHAWNEDRAEDLAKSAGLLSFNRARRIVRETQKLCAATWPALLEEAPPKVRDTVLKRLSDLVPPATAAARHRMHSPT